MCAAEKLDELIMGIQTNAFCRESFLCKFSPDVAGVRLRVARLHERISTGMQRRKRRGVPNRGG
jgi:hypothetical protein